MATAVEVERLDFGYNGHLLLRNLSFTVLQGDLAVLAGKNGAGKSTLLKLVVGLLRPWRGEVRVFGQNLRSLRCRDWLGYLPQVTDGSLYGSLPVTVEEMVAANLPLVPRPGLWPFSRKKEPVRRALEAVDLGSQATKPVNSLSGGQQRRMLLARALVGRPHLLVLDEPLTGLDRKSRERITELLLHLNRVQGVTILMTSHDSGALEAAGKVMYLQGGGLQVLPAGEEQGRSSEVTAAF